MGEASASHPALARALVTGGQGFIGAYVIRELLRRRSEVTLSDLKEAPQILEQVLSPEELSRIHCVFADITDAKAVKDMVFSTKPTVVVHLAGMQIPLVKSNPALGAAVNVNGTINIFEAVRALAAESGGAPAPVIYASSAAVLGPSEDYGSAGACLPAEVHCHKPRTLYGVLKLCNEGTARLYWQDHRVPSVGMRPLTVFGVGREAAILGRKFECQVTGVTGFQYVVDVARLFVDVAVGVAKAGGSHVCGVRGHLASHEDFLREAARAVPAVSSLASIPPGVPEVPIHADVDEGPLRALVGRQELHRSLADAVAEMAADFNALLQRGALKDNDLGPEPGKPALSKL